MPVVVDIPVEMGGVGGKVRRGFVLSAALEVVDVLVVAVVGVLGLMVIALMGKFGKNTLS